MRSEQAFMKAVEVALCRALPVRLWRQNAGRWRTEKGHWIEGAPKGAADLSGVVIGPGTRLEIEVKAKKGRISDEQQNWAKRMREFGCVYVLVQDDGTPEAIAHAIEQVRRAIGMVLVPTGTNHFTISAKYMF